MSKPVRPGHLMPPHISLAPRRSFSQNLWFLWTAAISAVARFRQKQPARLWFQACSTNILDRPASISGTGAYFMLSTSHFMYSPYQIF